jgi:putative methyltransferase (TIGR04325 family)
MKLFRSTLIGTGIRKAGVYLSTRALAGLKYVFAEMKYVPGGWYSIAGWNDPDVASAQEKHWPTLVANLRGPGPLGVAHFPWHQTREDRADHNVMMSYGYILALAAHNKEVLSILDWGGGAGHYYLYSKALLPEVSIDYHCYDVPSLSELGHRLLPRIHIGHDEKAFLNRQYDLVISSSSLHYFESWRDELRKLAAAATTYLYVARLQTVLRSPSFVAAHKPYHSGYREFPSWFINQEEFVNCARDCGFDLLREFVYYGKSIIRGAPERGDCRGYLLRRNRNTY